MSNLEQNDRIGVRLQPEIKRQISREVNNNRELYNTPADFVRSSIILNLTINKFGLREEVFRMIRRKRGFRK